VAGNKSAYDAVEALFAGSGKNVIYTSNVMPEIGVLEVDAANDKIRDLFIARITEAKGIGDARSMIADVIMPTPAAVLEAARLLADGTAGQPGVGELLLVDVGGATTDVYSVAKGTPATGSLHVVGLPEPYAKRTVEGDLGLFHNLDTLTETVEADEMPLGFHEAVAAMCAEKSVPSGEEQIACHLLLSKAAVRSAVNRHVGSLKSVATPNGEVWLQRGKDLTQVGRLVGAGGPICFSADPAWVLEGALFDPGLPTLLKPKAPQMLLDAHYILFALGLLAQSEPAKALALMHKYVTPLRPDGGPAVGGDDRHERTEEHVGV
jgi:uncharacterized protein (TIGR01319 family)